MNLKVKWNFKVYLICCVKKCCCHNYSETNDIFPFLRLLRQEKKSSKIMGTSIWKKQSIVIRMYHLFLFEKNIPKHVYSLAGHCFVKIFTNHGWTNWAVCNLVNQTTFKECCWCCCFRVVFNITMKSKDINSTGIMLCHLSF